MSLNTNTKIATVFYLVVSIIFMIPIAAYNYATVDQVNITVEDKERITTGDSSKYLVFTDTETFENTDAIFHMKFDSSDVYRKLKVGETYDCKVYGWRVPFFSIYRNIVNCK